MHPILSLLLVAAEIRGLVTFGGGPVPGASVVATNRQQKLTALTDAHGGFVFADLPDGSLWTVKVEMQMFASESRDFTAPANIASWELKAVEPLPPAAAIPATFTRTEATVSQSSKPAAPPKPDPNGGQPPAPQASPVPDELAQRAADGFLVNGSINNGAASPFAQLPAFGNNRRGQRGLYNGNLGVIINNSNFDARNYSLTGQATPKPAYNRLQALISLGGPIKIPGLTKRNNGPNFSLNYQWTRNSNASTQTGLMPTEAQRTGEAFGVPASAISPQARALLNLYPLPNFNASTRYNYQIPIVSGMHQDDLQTRVNKNIRRNFLSGNYSWQSTRTDTPDIFGFLDTGRVSGINAGFNYRRSFNPRTFHSAALQFSRLRTQVNPYFSNRENVSSAAGIQGNNQEAVNWGAPNLQFANGISPLQMAQASLIRNQTVSFTTDGFMNRGRHNLQYGYAHRRQQFNVLSQQDARGTFAFTGPNDFANFLRGNPDTATIAFGNADKYLRATIHELFLNDDYRVNPGLTINAGLRWDYWSPAREKYGRLVNLDLTQPGFSRATPVVNGSPLEPDRNNISPRIAFSWRPLPASSLVVRGGYGIYYDTSVYQPISMQMAQQAPLSRSLRISGTTANPLTLATGLLTPASSATTATTFSVDPRFRVGYSQNWQLSLQRDLPGGLQMSAAYSGGKGTRAQQQILPNTFPTGALEPSGFTYLMSNGNSIRHAGQFQLRRRLRNGLTASINYTYAKSIDNASLGGRNNGGSLIAQNWLDLSAERGRSNFDQRHLINAMFQYTTGMGKARQIPSVLRDWTIGTQINSGTGLPLTPVFFSPVRGTGVTGSIRPDYTGAAQFTEAGQLNPAAYAIPVAGQWGNAGRNTITGPRQLGLNASLSKTFRSTDRISFDFRLEAANALNIVTFPSWNTVVGNSQFGLPMTANPMRTVQSIFRMRF
jgi:trimeric autotransporter adhesin